MVGRMQNLTLGILGSALWMGVAIAAPIPLGDCNGDLDVDIIELQICLRIFLAPQLVWRCPACSDDTERDLLVLQGVIDCYLNPQARNCPWIDLSRRDNDGGLVPIGPAIE